MAQVIPFKGVRYDPSKVELQKVVAPPYDVISAEQGERYRSYLYNICHLILPGSDYQKAVRFFQEWQKKGVLVQDADPSFYFYTQEYDDRGVKKRRLGCIGLLRLEEIDGKGVLPHEHTLERPRVDRLSLLRSVQANLSPIFGIVGDQDYLFLKTMKHYVTQHPSEIQISADGVQHELWRVIAPNVCRAIQEALSDERILIADGHHRYESALAYRSERRRKNLDGSDATYEFVMTHFVSGRDEGLTIWPIHRVLRGGRTGQKEQILSGLHRFFEIRSLPLEEALLQMKTHSFSIYLKGRKNYLLVLQQNPATLELLKKIPESLRGLDISILHKIILETILEHPIDEDHICFTPHAEQAVGYVEEGEYDLALLLNPIPLEQIQLIAQGGTRLPPKSTYFYPKLLSGLVINKL